MTVTKCGNCRYYAKRPKEIMDRAIRPGVCLRTARAVSPEWKAPTSPCNSTYNVSHPRKPTHFIPKEQSYMAEDVMPFVGEVGER